MERMNREQALDFQRGEQWSQLCLEIDTQIAAATEKLLVCVPEQCVGLQEKIKALMFCKNLPQIIADREE
jgi:hypothetical protein